MTDTTPTITEFKTTNYKIIIPLEVYQKILNYVDYCPIEISGLGDIEYDPISDAFVINEVYLFKQECTSVSTVLDNDALDKFNYKQIKDNRPLPRFWWHSHADMGVFWSSTDEECMRQLRNNDYSVSIVFNHRHEALCRIIQWKPFPILVDNVPVEIDFAEKDIPEVIKKEVDKKVSEFKPPEPKTEKYKYGGKIYKYPQHFPDDEGFPPDDGDGFTPAVPKELFGRQTMSLPHNFRKAFEKVTKLHLNPIWHPARQEWVWISKDDDKMYVDIYNVLSGYLDERFNGD